MEHASGATASHPGVPGRRPFSHASFLKSKTKGTTAKFHPPGSKSVPYTYRCRRSGILVNAEKVLSKNDTCCTFCCVAYFTAGDGRRIGC